MSEDETILPTLGKVYPFESSKYETASDVDEILQSGLIGTTIDKEFPGQPSQLTPDHPFAWQSFVRSPKEDKGVVRVRGSWYRTMEYEVLHTGGFVRLCTSRGRIYWNAQNERGHETPDWKLHFSVHLDDLEAAWNTLAALWMEMKSEIGMKAVWMPEGGWSEGQRGREITVYIYQFSYHYKGYMQGVVPELDSKIFLDQAYEECYRAPFYYTFIVEAEKRLKAVGVRTRGCADGDLALPGCKYTSLRNEAFVTVPDNDCNVYPPNNTGWNAARQANPFLEVIFFLRARQHVLGDEN